MFRPSLHIVLLSVLIQCVTPDASFAARFHRHGTIIGIPTPYVVPEDDSLYEIARFYDIGIDAITDANPGVDPFIPPYRKHIIVPTQWILPDLPIRRGIVINLAEMRLYYYEKDGAKEVTTFPIGIGDEGKDTPVGSFTIVEKTKNPSWYVPKSIREEKPELPAVVPPGPDNPMGSHALRLSNRSILIHGTNRPYGIGTRNSHGCIRLYQEDIAQLFGMVRLGTRVTIVNQPVKVAVSEERVFIEVHEYEDKSEEESGDATGDRSGDGSGDGRDGGSDLFQEALKVLAARKLTDRVDLDEVRKASEQRTGLLVDVTRTPPLELGADPT